MNRAIPLILISCISISPSLAKEQEASEGATAPAEAKEAVSTAPTPQPPVEPAWRVPAEVKEEVWTAPAAVDPAKVIVTVTGADAKQSDVVRKVVDALEKSGIARIATAPDEITRQQVVDALEKAGIVVPPESSGEDSGITTRIGIQQHEPYDKIIALVKALQYAGVQHIAFGDPPADGKNTVFLVASTPQRSEDISRIERAVRHSAKENDLELKVFTAIPVQANADATGPQLFRPTPREASPNRTTPSPNGYAPSPYAPSPNGYASPYAPSPAYQTEITDLMNSGVDPKVLREQIVQLRDEYKSADKRVHALAESLRRSPDATKKAELRSAVLSAFLSRMELLQSELREMQTRLIESQASLKNRKRIRSQIVDRRVEDLLNPQLEWEETGPIDLPNESSRPQSATTVPPASEETPSSVATTIPAKSSTVPETTVTELEGEWHQVAYSDGEGVSHERHIYNKTFKGDRSTWAWAGGSQERRIKVNSDAKTIKYTKEEDGSYSMEHYELQGDQLIIREPGFIEGVRVTIYERGNVRLPDVVPTATKQQVAQWRSAIVEILVSGKAEATVDGQQTVGFGVIVGVDGTLVSHMSSGWSGALKDWPNIDARFDDGSQVPLEIVKESSGVVILRPKGQVDLEHHFPLSVGPTRIGDQVNVGQLTRWALGAPRPLFEPLRNAAGLSLGNRRAHLAVTKLQLSRTDRRVATLGFPVWQLNPVIVPNSHCLPVLSGDGELLAVTITDTGGLLLAIPTAQLQEMFPRTLIPAR